MKRGMRPGARILIAARVLQLTALSLLLTAGVPQERARGWLRGIPDVSRVVADLGMARLGPPVPVRFERDPPAAAGRARSERQSLLEARAFWRNLLGAQVEGGLLIADSAVWTAMVPDTWYGLPGMRVRTREDGLLALVAAHGPTRFGEEAGELAAIAPTAVRGLLVAHGLDSVEGAERYADLWRWVLVGEELADGLRIGAHRWWQRRIVGAAGAWLFMEAPRGEELVPGGAEVLRSWSWFFRSYYRSIARPLSEAGTVPPADDLRLRLELDARLLAFGRDLYGRYGEELFVRLRSAWPLDAPEMDTDEALDLLFEHLPELDHWRRWLEDPRGGSPAPIPPG